jgi:hypothetical protein
VLYHLVGSREEAEDLALLIMGTGKAGGAGCPSHCQVTLSQIHGQRCFNNRPVDIGPSSSAGRPSRFGRTLERVARHSRYERHVDVVRNGRLRCGPA